MKRIYLVLITVLMSLTLSGCFKSRTELFTYSITDTTFVYTGDSALSFLDREITYFSITFEDTNEITEERENYDANLFGDFSHKEIKVLNAILYIGINGNEAKRRDLYFKGNANPQRTNAYSIMVEIDEFEDIDNNFRIVLDFETQENNKDNKAKTCRVQIFNYITSQDHKNHLYFDLTRLDT